MRRARATVAPARKVSLPNARSMSELSSTSASPQTMGSTVAFSLIARGAKYSTGAARLKMEAHAAAGSSSAPTARERRYVPSAVPTEKTMNTTFTAAMYWVG